MRPFRQAVHHRRLQGLVVAHKAETLRKPEAVYGHSDDCRQHRIMRVAFNRFLMTLALFLNGYMPFGRVGKCGRDCAIDIRLVSLKIKVCFQPECLTQNSLGRGENGDFENRSGAYIWVCEPR